MSFDPGLKLEKIKDVKKITENTLVPIGLVAIFVGGVIWFTNLAAETRMNSNSIAEIKSQQGEYNKDMQSVREALVRIEEQLRRGK